VGKKNLKKILEPFRGLGDLAFVLLFGCLSAGCHKDLGEYLQSGRVLPLHGLQGRWVGLAVPADTSCGPTTKALMTIGEEGFGLDPFQSSTVITGKVSDDGHLVGELVRQGAERREVSINFEGVASGLGLIEGTLRSGRCHWTVELRRG
jgi:hypothetical protein